MKFRKLENFRDSQRPLRHSINEELLIEDIDALVRSVGMQKDFAENPEKKQEILDIIALDPTADVQNNKNGQYSKWLLDKYKKGDPFEDKQELTDRLGMYDYLRIHNRLRQLDMKYTNLYTFKTTKDFIDFMHSDEVNQLLNQSSTKNKLHNLNTDNAEEIRKGAKFIGENENWEIWSPRNYEASKYLCHTAGPEGGENLDAKWCTGWTQSDYQYNTYTNGSKLYVFINKDPHQPLFNAKYQLDLWDMDYTGRGGYEFEGPGTVREFLDGTDHVPAGMPSNRGDFFIKFVLDNNLLSTLKQTELKDYKIIKEIDNLLRLYDGQPYIYDGTNNVSSRTKMALGNVVFSENVTSISDNAFSGCSSLKSITIPEQITSIGKSAFATSGLENIEIPSNIQSIGENAFSGCANLKTAVVSTNISKNMFENCSSLTNVTITEGVKSIGQSAFKECIKLNSVEIPNSVSEIGQNVFEHSGLPAVPSLGSVTEIPAYAFIKCTMPEIKIPDTVKSIGYLSFGMVFDVKKIFIPASVTDISTYGIVVGKKDASYDGVRVFSGAPSRPEGWAHNAIHLSRTSNPQGGFMEPQSFGIKYNSTIEDFNKYNGQNS